MKSNKFSILIVLTTVCVSLISSMASGSDHQGDYNLFQSITVKNKNEIYQPGEKVIIFKNDCFISSARHGTQQRCLKSKLVEGKVLSQLSNGDWVIQANSEINLSNNILIEKDSSQEMAIKAKNSVTEVQKHNSFLQ